MTYEFDDVIVDAGAFRLSRDGKPVHIEPKALEILILLLQRRERLVLKQELFDEIWPGVAVTENALTRAIAQLRKTLGDDAATPRYIETVPTRGYRFIGTLRAPASSPVASPTKRRRWFIFPIVLVPLLILGILVLRRLPMFMKPYTAWEAEQPPIAATLLHPSPRLQVSPSFSPDGTSVVYTSEAGGVPHLFISAIAGGEERQLTSGRDGEAQPVWSPDGKQIAFTSIGRRGIWLIDVAGGAIAQLTTFGSRPSWSADGTEIAFQSGDDVEYGWNSYDALPPSTIWIVDVDSRKTSPLTRPAIPPGGHGAPSWRRDGKRIAFSSCDHERCGIYTIARDATGLTQLISDSRRLTSPRFAHDGRTVYGVFARYNESTLIAIGVDADGNRAGDHPRRLRESNPGVIQHIDLSRDGFRFAWSVVEEKSDLYSVDLASGTVEKVISSPTVNATFPSFSPDGKKIAYCSVAAGDDSGIWIADSNGANPKALVTGPGLKQYARWGRGEWDVFYGAWSVADHRPLLFHASLITGRSVVMASLPEDAAAPAISPDLRTVAFNRTIDGKTSVWASAVDGSSLRRMSNVADLARFPVWSPDGKRVAVQLRREASVIAILPGSRVVVKDAGENWPHSWSPDGKQIAFAGRRGGVWNVWTVNVDSGKQTRVTNFTSMIGWVRTPSWSPDGKRIVFEAGRPSGNVWISEPRVTQ